MSDQGDALRKAEQRAKQQTKQQELARLKDAAFAALEQRGYDVRGKTTSQIREILRRPPQKPHAAA
jgi:hypothetical protein